ncbi:MAG TPA: type III secretion system outer membrane ring subunit SctC [Prosthecobacter sp.]
MKRASSLCLVFILVLVAGDWSCLHAQAYSDNGPPWRSARVNFAASQRPVRDLLKEFAAAQKMPLSLSDSVKGVVSGTFQNIETQKFLNAMCESNDLTWFYDGVRLNIESADEVLSRPLSLPSLSAEGLSEVLYSMGYSSGPPGREVEARRGHRMGLILLVGGPQYVQATEALARDLDSQESRRSTEEISVRTFRLNYASAIDLNYNTGSTTTRVPGVVSSLQNLMMNQVPGSSLSTGTEETELERSRPGLRGTGLAAIGQQPGNPFMQERPAAGMGMAQQQPERATAPDPRDPRAPMIVADARLNAVLVRDVAARMPLYEELIRMLDVPTRAIEITAAIVDIDSNNGRNVGLELLGFGKDKNDMFRLGFDADRGLFDGNNTQGQTPSFFDGANLARGGGLNATALIGGAGYQLLTRLRAIEQAGAGQIVSSPSVLTMENVQAVIRTDEKVYVRVAGNMQVDLFDVSTGVQLRVTPTLVREGGRQDYRLQIDIKDGSFVDQTVDNIPTTRESAINTQAIVPENKTLLLGGYFVERRTDNKRRVPLLHKIPVLGKVFSQDEKAHNRSQRFFFITPRLVEVGREATAPSNFADTQANDLLLPDRLAADETSRKQAEDLARRLATGGLDVMPSLKNNPLLPELRDVPKAMPVDESAPATTTVRPAEPSPNRPRYYKDRP